MEYSYYGQLDDKKPKKELAYLLFQEAMNRCLEKNLNLLQRESDKLQKKHADQFEKLIVETKTLNSRFGELLKIFEKDEMKEKIKEDKRKKNKMSTFCKTNKEKIV